MLEVLTWIVSGAVMVGVLVIVHEAGHYVVARLFGVGTPVFSIGMGPRIFGFRFWETDFRISLLPIGGYVRMAGADAFGEEYADDSAVPDEDFMRKPVWQRFLVMLAGPAANIILPFLLFTAVRMAGMPQPDPVVGYVEPGSVAEELGLQEEDEVVSVAGQPVTNWNMFLRQLIRSEQDDVPVSLVRQGQPVDVTIPVGSIREEERSLGMYAERLSSRIGVSDRTSPAWKAGLRPGDYITEVDGQEVLTLLEARRVLEARPGRHALKIQRQITEGETQDWLGRMRPKVSIQKLEIPLELDPTWSPEPSDTLTDAYGLLTSQVFVGRVRKESAADKAGVRPGDRLLSIDGTTIDSWDSVVGLVAATVDGLELEKEVSRSSGCMGEDPEIFGRPLKLVVVRDGEPLTLEFRPKVERFAQPPEVTYRPIMGVEAYPNWSSDAPEHPEYLGLGAAVPLAVEEGVSRPSGHRVGVG